ncbi:unnamed protein product [marine sediment metagenome]|uniref:Uncharacterized protein n=1 Tax=marine sediment metagenome TaxID=412755 RepID=X1H3U4_9ZZZZ
MIEPDYDSLSNELLCELCDKRKIPRPPKVSTAVLLDMLIDYDYDRNQEPWE